MLFLTIFSVALDFTLMHLINELDWVCKCLRRALLHKNIRLLDRSRGGLGIATHRVRTWLSIRRYKVVRDPLHGVAVVVVAAIIKPWRRLLLIIFTLLLLLVVVEVGSLVTRRLSHHARGSRPTLTWLRGL